MTTLGSALGIDDLKKGDVLLLRDGIWDHLWTERTHKLIGFGQSVLSHGSHRHANIVHAGLYDGTKCLVEASGEAKGLRAHKLAKKSAHYTFLVFRYDDEIVARKAVVWAKFLTQERNEAFGHYSKAGALGSLMHRSAAGTKGARLNGKLQKWATNFQYSDDSDDDDDDDDSEDQRLLKIKANTALYCSGFVVQCYVLATPRYTTPAINLDYRYVSPKRLEGELRRKTEHWTLIGHITAGAWR